MKQRHFCLLTVTILFYIVAIILEMLEKTDLSIVLNIITAVMTIISIRLISGNFSNITILFCAFSIIYGLSGPITVQYGEGLNELFGNEFNINAFLIAYDLANIGFIIGMIFYNSSNKKRFNKQVLEENFYVHKKKYIILAMFCMTLGTSFEFINFLRVGGISTLIKGKAIYQAAVANLSLTLPSDIFISIAVELCTLYFMINKIRSEKIDWMSIGITICIAMPFLVINIFLGKRGILLALALIIFLTVTYFKPIKFISKKLIILFVILYLVMTFLYANRAIMPLLLTDKNKFIDKAFSKEKIEKALNPGGSEFGAAFGNFNKLYTKENYEFKYGETYLKGLVVFIPSFLYIGEKPQQITYEFRDEYFASEAKRSSIAGTAFSSILEAYWNFGYVGVFVVYLIIGYTLQKMDTYWREKNENSFLLYILISPFLISFHRSAFGDIIANIILKTIILIIFVNVPLRISKEKLYLKEKTIEK